MGLFGPSKSELADRIDELETELEDTKDRLDSAETDARVAREDASVALDDVHGLKKVVNKLEDYDTVEDKNGVVETLDEPRIAWKATENHILKLLLPEGTTVVHPERKEWSLNNKKRCDGAIPIAVHEPETPLTGDTGAVGVGDMSYEIESDAKRFSTDFTYELGELAEPKRGLDENVKRECTDGIHFFCNQRGAINWF